jgi:hypothetical protein
MQRNYDIKKQNIIFKYVVSTNYKLFILCSSLTKKCELKRNRTPQRHNGHNDETTVLEIAIVKRLSN